MIHVILCDGTRMNLSRTAVQRLGFTVLPLYRSDFVLMYDFYFGFFIAKYKISILNLKIEIIFVLAQLVVK